MQPFAAKLKSLAKPFVPPIMWNMASQCLNSCQQKSGIHNELFEGSISSWEHAVAHSDGWDATVITEKTLAAALKVRDKIVEFEQDTKTHQTINYSTTILAFLLLALSRNKDNLNIIDFGGSLATNCFQNRKILQRLKGTSVTWTIIERSILGKLGAENFECTNLQFFTTIDEAVKGLTHPSDSFLFSGSLQYVAEPLATVDQAISAGAKLLAFDRILVSPTDTHAIYIQHPDPKK